MVRRWFASFSFVIVAASAFGATADSTVGVPKARWKFVSTSTGMPIEKLSVGDQLTLELKNAPSESFEIKTLKDHQSFLGGGFLLSQHDRDRIDLTVLRVGPLTVFPMKLVNDEGKIVRITEEFSFVTNGQPPQVEAPAFKPPVRLPWPEWIKYSIWAAIAVIALLVVGFALFGLKRWAEGRSAPVTQNGPKPYEHDVAIREIEKIRADAPWKKREYKKLVFGVSDALKVYFSDRYTVDAVESTTEEMLRLLEKRDVSGRALDDIESAFSRLDRVKFTDYVPNEKECVSILNDAVRIVNDSKRLPRPESVLEAGGRQ